MRSVLLVFLHPDSRFSDVASPGQCVVTILITVKPSFSNEMDKKHHVVLRLAAIAWSAWWLSIPDAFINQHVGNVWLSSLLKYC